MDSKPNQDPQLAFSVSASDVGERLDAFLAAHVEGWSRARLQRLIEDAEVLVNGHVAKSAYKLRADDEIEVELSLPSLTAFTPENIPLDIVFEDDELIVVNKPAGMIVHPAAGVDTGTLANALAFHFAQLPKTGGATRPGIVHRLDKGTSGLLVVAKTETVHEHLSDQFRARDVFKSYIALVHGRVEKKTDQIDQPIARDPRNRIRMAVVTGGRPAISIYRVRRRFDRFTLLDVELKTGRTHQIRVHLAWLKHPVVGDEVYGGGRDKTVVNPQVRSQIAKLGRQFLHAERLGFRHPRTAEQMIFTAEPSTDLQKLVNELK
jgi:23S rRNA pseudouridine1911/1915/1917 synthase